MQEEERELEDQPAQHTPEAVIIIGTAAAQCEMHCEMNAPKQLAARSSPDRAADQRQVQGSTQQPEAQAVLTIGLRVSGPDQQPDQQERSLPAQSSEPAPALDQLCPSLNLKFFTQAGVLQLSGAEMPQHRIDWADRSHVSREAVQERPRGNIIGAEAAGEAAGKVVPLGFTETAVEEEGPVATTPAPPAATGQCLALCLQLDATQLEADLVAPEQADATAEEPCITLIPDTMEPCSASKDTPKSEQRSGQAAADQCHVEAQPASAAKQNEEAQAMTEIPAPEAEAGHEDLPGTPPQDPARRCVKP